MQWRFINKKFIMGYFVFAEKDNKTVMIQYSDNWWEEAINFLVDNGYKISSSSEWHWNRQIDEIGRTVPCWEFDNDFDESYFMQKWSQLEVG